jgi:hypothetical protein
MTEIDKVPVLLMVHEDDKLSEALSLSLANAAKLFTLELVFSTDEPEEALYYLVLGRLECPNGFIGPHFVVCQFLIGVADAGAWYVAPDGPAIGAGLPMWDGSGMEPAPFTPIKWALLPQAEE